MIKNKEPQQLYYSGAYHGLKMPLRMVFVMTRTDICRGVKMIFQQANRLVEKGFEVSILAYGPQPTWHTLEAKFISVPLNIQLTKALPDCDLIVATYYTQISGCILSGIAPVVYLEQGGVHLYHFDEYSLSLQAYMKRELSSCAFILTVSKSLQKELKNRFSLTSEVIDNAIDEDIFYKEEYLTYTIKDREDAYVLMMGEDALDYKGIKDIIKAVEIIKKQFTSLKLYWITPKVTDESLLDQVDQVFSGIHEEEIAELFRHALVYVSGSYYGSFSLPVVEAMACGCPVISRFNLGVSNYAKDGDNILITTGEGHQEIVDKLHQLLDNPGLKDKMVKKGLCTIKRYLWKNTIDQYAQYYKSIIAYKLVERNALDEWNYESDVSHYEDPQDLIKLEKLLTYTEAQEVYGIFLTNGVWGTIGRWDVLATRVKPIKKQGHKRKTYCLVYQRDTKAYVQEGEHFPHLQPYLNMILKDQEIQAEKELSKRLEKEKTQSEYWLLYAYLQLTLGNQDIDYIGSYLRIIGDQVNQDYFVYDVVKWFEKMKELPIPIMKDPQDQQTQCEICYFADKLFTYELYHQAATYYEKFLQKETSETYRRVAAYRQMALCYYFLKEHHQAMKCLLKAFLEAPPRADECYLLGLLFKEEGKIKESCYWYEAALLCKRPEVEQAYIQESNWYLNPLLALCVLHYELGHIREAMNYNERAKAYVTNDKEKEVVDYNTEFFAQSLEDSSLVN